MKKPRKPWTGAELKKTRTMAAAGASSWEIAEALGKKPGCVLMKCHREGITLHPDRRRISRSRLLDDKQIETLRTMAAAGMTLVDAARLLNLHDRKPYDPTGRKTLLKIARAWNVKFIDGRTREARTTPRPETIVCPEKDRPAGSKPAPATEAMETEAP